ncbi:MAG: DUF1629 domain-containing protein [Bacteroidota bacterium]
MRYYKLEDEIDYPSRWYLCGITTEQGMHLYYDEAYSPSLTANINQDGIPLDFTSSDDNFIPIVSELLMNVLNNRLDVIFIPTEIKGYYGYLKYYTMIATMIVDCVDEKKSEFNKFEVNDPVRPDKAGDYRAFFKLVIDKNKVLGKDIFRVARSTNTLIISERIKNLLESEGFTGLKFKEV